MISAITEMDLPDRLVWSFFRIGQQTLIMHKTTHLSPHSPDQLISLLTMADLASSMPWRVMERAVDYKVVPPVTGHGTRRILPSGQISVNILSCIIMMPLGKWLSP